MIFLKRLGMSSRKFTKFIHMTTRYKTFNVNSISSLKFTIPYQHLHKKYCFHTLKEDNTDSDNEEVDNKRNIKNIILPHSDDKLTVDISECKSLQNVFELIQQNDSELNWKNISMAIAMVREFQLMYYRICLYEKNLNCTNIIPENNFENIFTNDNFLHLLDLVEKHYEHMDIHCLSYSLLCLHKIGIDKSCTVYEKLSQRLKTMLIHLPVTEIPPSVLSRFTVAIINRRNLSGLYILKDIWPIILKKIGLCDSCEDLKHISICLYNLPWFLNESVMDSYIVEVKNILLSKTQDDDKFKCIVKVLRLLNSPDWFHRHIDLTRTLLLNLQGFIRHLTLYDMIQIQMIILKQFEPYQVFQEIHSVTSEWLSKIEVDTDITVLRLLSCIVPSSSGSRRKHIETILRQQFLINKSFSYLCIGPLFNIIRNLKTSDLQICDAYWLNVMDWLNSGKPSLREIHKLLRICNRYMNFNNNMAGTYRNYTFEKQMIKWLNEELDHGICLIIPSQFSKIFSFFVSYPNDSENEIPEVLVKKVLDNINQYNVYDCYIISRGLNNAFINRKKKLSLPTFLDQYVRICTSLNKRCLKILNQEQNLNINQLNSMFRGYNHRVNVNEPELFYKILDRYKSFTSQDFSSRAVRELTYSLVVADWFDSKLMDKCLEYYTNNYKYLLAENVEKILTLFFSHGVSTEKFIEFLPCAVEIINRDKVKMSGLNFMRASLALCYFYSLPSSIADYLFSVDFLEKLDDELNNCYAKVSYPFKVRQLLMILNRTVCIDYPEFDVPWFHTKYCEEIQSLVPKHTGSFYLDVENKLNQLITNKGNLKIISFSPYGYQLDFEINLNTSRKHNNSVKNEKITVLLLNEKNLRKTDNELKGYSKLKQRHLEILGYKVIWIKKSIWNSMFMSEPEAKLSYLKDLIWPKY